MDKWYSTVLFTTVVITGAGRNRKSSRQPLEYIYTNPYIASYLIGQHSKPNPDIASNLIGQHSDPSVEPLLQNMRAEKIKNF